MMLKIGSAFALVLAALLNAGNVALLLLLAAPLALGQSRHRGQSPVGALSVMPTDTNTIV